jgi:hypothetical protein
MSTTDRRGRWSQLLAQAIRSRLETTDDPISIVSITEASGDLLEVVYRQVGDEALRGIRLKRTDFDAGSELRLAGREIDELALAVVFVALGEPRDLDAYSAPDAAGVRWLPVERWAD